jgi:hypothetical protein
MSSPSFCFIFFQVLYADFALPETSACIEPLPISEMEAGTISHKPCPQSVQVGNSHIKYCDGKAMVSSCSFRHLHHVYHLTWGWVKTLVPLVNPKIAGKWMFIPLKMVLIGIDPYPHLLQLNATLSSVLSALTDLSNVCHSPAPQERKCFEVHGDVNVTSNGFITL